MCICINYPPIGVYNIVYNIHKLWFEQISLWFHMISLCVKQKLYDISCNFIMCERRDFALFLVKICRIIQKYPPFCRKDFFQKTMVVFSPTGQKISMLGRDTTHPLLYIIFILVCQAKNSYNFLYCIYYKKYCIQ